MSRVPTPGIDYTSKDYDAFRQQMLTQLGIKMPEYTDMRESDAGIVLLDLLAQGLDVISYYQDVMANEAFLVTAEQRNNVLKWCQMLSYIPRAATPAEFKQVFILSSAQLTDTTIPQGTVVKTVNSAIEAEVKFETIADLVIPAGNLGNEQDKSGNYLFQADVIQGSTVDNELLGSSNGTPNQAFMLNYTPVIPSSLKVYVNEGSGFEPWTRVDNFVDSTADSKNFVVTINDNDQATVIFGSGVFGKIPSMYTNGIYCSYRIGGGEAGNVGANKITVMDSNIALVSSTFNPSVAEVMGYDKESIEEIKVNAPNSNRNIWGALTLEDFADVVLANFPDVKYAIAKQDSTDVDDIHIYVLLNNNLSLDDTLKNSILSFFDENEGGRKIVGCNLIYVEEATLVPLDLVCTLIVKDRYSQAAVKADIQAFLTNYFFKGNYPFGTELSLSALSAEVMSYEQAISGIKSFRFTSPEEDVLTPAANEIYALNTLTFNVTGGNP